MSLADAIACAIETLAVIRSGVNPVSERRSKPAAIKWTLKRCALAYIAGHKDGWKNAERVQQCENTLTTYAFPTMGGKNVRDDQLRAVADTYVLRAPVGVVNKCLIAFGWRAYSACSRTSSTKSVRMELFTRQPTMRRADTSIKKATYNQHCQVET